MILFYFILMLFVTQHNRVDEVRSYRQNIYSTYCYNFVTHIAIRIQIVAIINLGLITARSLGWFHIHLNFIIFR